MRFVPLLLLVILVPVALLRAAPVPRPDPKAGEERSFEVAAGSTGSWSAELAHDRSPAWFEFAVRRACGVDQLSPALA